MAMSRSVVIPASLPSAPRTGTAPTSWSRMTRAAASSMSVAWHEYACLDIT